MNILKALDTLELYSLSEICFVLLFCILMDIKFAFLECEFQNSCTLFKSLQIKPDVTNPTKN